MPDQNNKPSNNHSGSNGGPRRNDSGGRRTLIIYVAIAVLVIVFLGSQFFSMNKAAAYDELITSEFVQAVQEDRVVDVTYSAGDYTVTGTYYPAVTAGTTASKAFNKAMDALNADAAKGADGDVPKVETSDELASTTLGSLSQYKSTYVGQDSLIELLNEHPKTQYTIKLPAAWLDVLVSLLPIVLIGIFLIYFLSQMNKANNSQMGFGKVKNKKNPEEHPDVHFSDVAGVDEAVEEMREIKDFLANPAKYQSMGAKIPRGCLLVGPPGTGKTLLARAVAGEAEVPFFSISGSDFVEMFVGVGASRVRDLFQQAKDAAPAIIFIDEIDAVGRQRGAGLGGGHDEREQTLNQLLVEMDGFDKNDSVVLIAATNRSDILDPALLRPGRFDRQIVVDAPDLKGRKRILEVHSKDKPIGSDVDLEKIAALTPGFTGADLANLMNESALLTARRNQKIITMKEVTESMERVIAGPERKGRLMDDETRRTIAYHESGHALVGHTLPKADPVHKISIISRGRALGYTLSIPKEDKVLNSRSEMFDELAVFMGGRVAEEIYCDDITTGASNDLERATKMARAMVTQYGMSTELGQQIFGQPNHEVFLGRDYGNTQDYSEETARRIDDEVARIMKEAHDRAYEILVAHKDQMDLMASVLLERETVDGEACQALLDNKWNEYLEHEDEIIARKEAEEAAARAKDALLVNPNWVEPADDGEAGLGAEALPGAGAGVGGAGVGGAGGPGAGGPGAGAQGGAFTESAGGQQGSWQQDWSGLLTQKPIVTGRPAARPAKPAEPAVQAPVQEKPDAKPGAADDLAEIAPVEDAVRVEEAVEPVAGPAAEIDKPVFEGVEPAGFDAPAGFVEPAEAAEPVEVAEAEAAEPVELAEAAEPAELTEPPIFAQPVQDDSAKQETE